MSDETSPTGDHLPGTIGRYQVTGTLGFGAMGAVYKAFDPLIKRTLAIKTIRLDVPKHSPQHEAFIARFYQEARISGTLSHPNIVTLFDIGEEGGLPFLAMEFIDGRTIASYIEEGTRFAPEKVVALASQVAAALDYAHSRGVVHRDIKPSNLMIHDGEKVKVTDFGIAKLADAEITHSGALLGTPSYMSPEQAMGERLDGRSDIFSLGVCAFEMLSGLQPFPGANITSILYKLVHVDPVEPADLEALGLLPQKWREVFNKVLAKKPENRYQTASEFVKDLEFCLGSWFSGLGEATISLAVPPAVENTVALEVPALDPGPPAELEPASDAATVLLAPAPAAEPAEPELPATVLLRPAVAAQNAEPELPATVLLRPAVAAEPPPAAVVPAAADVADGPTVRLPAYDDDARAATIQMASPVVPAPLPTERQAVATTEALPVPRQPRPGLPAAWVIGGAAAVLLVGAGLAGLALWRRSHVEAPIAQAQPAPAPVAAAAQKPELPPAEPASAVATGSLRIESEPAGARVRVNGQPSGQTPLELPGLPPGEYEVRLDYRGYEGQSRRVALSAEAPAAQVRVKLTRSVPATGSAEIVSTPAGASVTVDGKPLGRTPLAASALPAGARAVQLALEGHEPWSGTIDVVAGQKGRVEVRLKPLPARPKPTPTPEVVDTARVYGESEVDVRPRKRSGNSPSYPSDRAPRLRSGERVSVLLELVVSETGEVQDATVVESGGKAVDEVVLRAVRSWRFDPATKGGTRVKARTVFKQTFLGG